MFEFILFLAIFIGIMAISALIFGGWFIVMLVRGIGGFLGIRPTPPPIPVGPRRPSGAVQIGPIRQVQGGQVRQVQDGPLINQCICAYELCKATNDINAKFCRRCGRELVVPSPVRVRRAAVW